MAGPGGRGLRAAERYVFLADATGLPAIGRMVEALPADATGEVVVEVDGAAEEQALAAPPGIIIRWLHRRAGVPSLLPAAFDGMSLPADGPAVYLWAAMEYEAFRSVRAAARERMRPGQDQHLVVSYWRAGMAEEQHATGKKAEAKAA